MKKNGKKVWDAKRIHSLRLKLGDTQEAFAHRLGVTFVSVNRWEKGKTSPRGLSLAALTTAERG